MGAHGRFHPAVHHMYMAKKVTPRFRKPQYRRTFIRQWRKYRNDMSLEALADRISAAGVETTHASLSRIERGLQPYNQALLEAAADALQTDVASLLMRDPSDSEGLWSIWDQAKPGEKQMIVTIAKTVTGKTGTGG
jgi:hypothetical protein